MSKAPPEFFSKCGVSLKNSKCSSLVSASSARSAGAGSRPDGRVISAQYFSDLSIRISEIDCASVPSNLIFSMKFSWLSSLRKAICAMCFTDGGSVLIIATVDLCVYLVDVESLCEAKTISNDDDDDMDETLLNRSTKTTEGIVSFSSICAQLLPNELPLLSSLFSVEMSLGQQLKPDGGDVVDLERFVDGETPTCIKCFCPASVVIRRLLQSRDIKARGSDSVNSISLDDFSSKCDGRFVILGHASGRVTIVNISSSIRHVVWSTFLDNGNPISSLSLFSDLASLCEQGIWSLPRDYNDHRDNEPSNLNDNHESSAESLEASVMGSLFPSIINVPGCSVLIGSRNHYFRLPLERSHPSPFSERRAAAEVAQALWSLTDGSRANASGSTNNSHNNRIYRNVPSWASDLPEPKWTQTILDITGVAAVTALVQRSDSTSTLPSDTVPRISTKEMRPGTIRYFPVNSDAQNSSILPSTSSQSLQQLGSSSNTTEHKQISSVFPNALTASSKTAPAPKSRRRQSFAGMLGFADLETQPDRIESTKQVLANSRFPSLPATFRMLPSEFRPVRLHQSPRRCYVSSEVSIKRKTSVVTVLYLTNDSKYLIFDPSLGDQPLFEMLLPSRSRESLESSTHVFSSLQSDVTSCQLLTVNASFVAYADGIVFMGENVLIEPSNGELIKEESPIDNSSRNERTSRSAQALEVESATIPTSSSESFVSEADISVDDEGSKSVSEPQAVIQATSLSTSSNRVPMSSYRGRIFVVSANLAQRCFRDVQIRQKISSSDSLSTLNEPLLVPSDAILQTFDLSEGEVITGMQRVLLPLASTESKPSSMNVSLVVSTSKSAFCLIGRDVNDGPSLIKRLVKKEISEDNSGSLSEIVMSLLKRITYINRLAFALGIVAADAILSLADDTCSALAENLDSEIEDIPHFKHESKLDAQEDGPLDFLSLNIQSIRIGSLSRCKLVEQAFALYTIASANPLRAVKALTSAGRPDLGVAYAAGALGEGSLFESMAEESWKLYGQKTSKPPGSLPVGSFASRQPSPADRTRLANLLLQCQLISMKTTNRQERFQCRAFSNESFVSWLAQSSDLQPEKAIPWLVANGYAYEAIVVAHARIASAKGLMIMALTSIANTGIDCLVENDQCLQYLSSNGYENELLTFAGGLFLRALNPSSLKHFAVSFEDDEDDD